MLVKFIGALLSRNLLCLPYVHQLSVLVFLLLEFDLSAQVVRGNNLWNV